MKIGLQLYLGGEAASTAFLRRAAPAIEERGFHGIWLAEHIILPAEIKSAYPYSADGSFPFDPKLLPLEPFTALAFVAALTKTLRLGTGVSVLTQRNPIFAAKQAADVDNLSDGRLDFGIGAGWCLEEIEILGTPTDRRGARVDDYIRAMQAIWTQDTIRHQGDFITLPPSHSGPKPIQKPHPPLYIGGNNALALRRLAALGDGWFAAAMSPEDFARHRTRLATFCSEAGRDIFELKLAVGPAGGKTTLSDIEAYAAAGADQVILALSGRDIDRFLSRLDGLAENLVQPARTI
jgi:probable F420-dependent oxidoreductase